MSCFRRRWRLSVLAIAACLFCIGSAQAEQVVLNPSADIWIRESAPTSVYEDDLMSVWAAGPDMTRYGLLAFDLSGVTGEITGAHIELYAIEYWRHSTPTKQTAAFFTPPDVLGASWDSYHASATETPFETLGKYDIPADSPQDQYYASDPASAADLALLNSAKTDGTIGIVFKPVTWEEETTRMYGTRDWADSGYFSDLPEIWPRLLLNGGSIEIVAGVDTWIRESGGIYEDDWISVWDGDTEPGNRRYGMLEFDLSTVDVPITDAQLRLYAIADSQSGHNWEAFEQIAFSVDPAGLATDAIDFATYETLTKTQFEALGHYEFELNNEISDTFCDSDAATAADIAVLQAIASANGALVMSLQSVPVEITQMQTLGGQRDWADTGYLADQSEKWPRLVLEIGGSAGLEGDLNGDGLVGSADLDIVRGNWGQSVEAGCLSCGDPSGDGLVGSADLDIVRANWGNTAAASVPEPSVLVLLLMAAAWLIRRR